MANRYINNDLTEEQKEFIKSNAKDMNMNQLAKVLELPKYRIYKYTEANNIEVKAVFNKVKKGRDDGMFDYDRMYL